MIEYSTLPTHRGSIIRHRSFAAAYPWCFDERFIPKNRQPGIAPIVGVYGDREKHAFIAATSVSEALTKSEFVHRLRPQQNLLHALTISNEWLIDNLPMWIQNQPKQHHFVQLTGSPVENVDGASAGLSTLLATIGSLLKLPLPIDYMYSAVVYPDGRLGKVNSIVEKAKGIEKFCPVVKHLIIASPIDPETLRELSDSTLTIHSVRSVQEALNIIPIGSFSSIQEALEHSLERWLARDDEALPTFIEHVFLSALQGLTQIYGWGSLHNMLMGIKRSVLLYPTLSFDQQCKLDITMLIAERYLAGKHGQNKEFDANTKFTNDHLRWLEGCKKSDRLKVLPHLMQQITEHPNSLECKEAIKSMVEDSLPDRSDDWANPLLLRLAGAWGRYLTEHTKQYAEAYDWQRFCYTQWCALGIYAESSYPICALLELSLYLPNKEPEIEKLWREFSQQPNVKVSQIKRFVPKHWRERLFGMEKG